MGTKKDVVATKTVKEYDGFDMEDQKYFENMLLNSGNEFVKKDVNVAYLINNLQSLIQVMRNPESTPEAVVKKYNTIYDGNFNRIIKTVKPEQLEATVFTTEILMRHCFLAALDKYYQGDMNSIFPEQYYYGGMNSEALDKKIDTFKAQLSPLKLAAIKIEAKSGSRKDNVNSELKAFLDRDASTTEDIEKGYLLAKYDRSRSTFAQNWLSLSGWKQFFNMKRAEFKLFFKLRNEHKNFDDVQKALSGNEEDDKCFDNIKAGVEKVAKYGEDHLEDSKVYKPVLENAIAKADEAYAKDLADEEQAKSSSVSSTSKKITVDLGENKQNPVLVFNSKDINSASVTTNFNVEENLNIDAFFDPSKDPALKIA